MCLRLFIYIAHMRLKGGGRQLSIMNRIKLLNEEFLVKIANIIIAMSCLRCVDSVCSRM